MTLWANFERMSDNDLPLPSYCSTNAAGFDFGVCLTRECKEIKSDGTRISFYVGENGERIATKAPTVTTRELWIHPLETIMIPLGYKCEFHQRSVLQLHIRSSMGIKGLMLANSVGIVDADYRGELLACVYNRTDSVIQLSHGQRIVQGILLPYSPAIITEKKVNDTIRADGGFGSTGL